MMAAVMLVGLAGCRTSEADHWTARQRPTFPVTGEVTFRGSPVAGAHVTFHPREEGPAAFGVTDDDGNFTLQTYSEADGAPAGDYTVTVHQSQPLASPRKSGEELFREMESQSRTPARLRTTSPLPKSALPTRYANTRESSLRAVVNAGEPNEFSLNLHE